MPFDKADVGQLVCIFFDKRLLIGQQPFPRPGSKAAGGGHKGLSGTRRHLGGYAVLLGFLLRIGQTHGAVKGFAQQLAVDIAADGDLVLEPFVLACWLFSWHNNKTPFLSREGVIK